MNAKKSWIIWVVGVVIFVGVVAAFAYGAQQTETTLKIAWMGGSLAVAALGIFLSYKLRK